jgi:hypothetical protein
MQKPSQKHKKLTSIGSRFSVIPVSNTGFEGGCDGRGCGDSIFLAK